MKKKNGIARTASDRYTENSPKYEELYEEIERLKSENEELKRQNELLAARADIISQMMIDQCCVENEENELRLRKLVTKGEL